MPETQPAQLEWLFGLIVHDLRNPAATLAANLSFVRDGLQDPSVPAPELYEALSDSQQALGDLMRGLDQLSWMGRWFNDRTALTVGVQDLRETFQAAEARVKHGLVEFVAPERECRVVGGEALERLIDLLISNGHQHAQGRLVRVRAVTDAEPIVVEICDDGRPIAPELEHSAFTLEGQLNIKGRADGRYGRVLALFAAGILAKALGAELTSEARAGKNVFRIQLRAG